MNLLTVAAVSKKKDDQFVLKDITFRLPRYGKIAIAGETGSGKTTLLKIIAGLIQPDEGRVMLEDIRVLGPDEKLIAGHPAIAYVSQQFELRNAYRVEEVLAYASELPEEEALSVYKICRIDHLLKRRTDQLSGGERQRVAICRLLVSAPRLLLLDEPFSNLDMIHKNILKSVIRDIGLQLGISCIMVSHSSLDTLSWADEIIILKDGCIIQQGSPADIYRCPVNEYAAALFGGYNLLPSAVSGLFLPGRAERLFTRPEDFKIMPPGNGVKADVTSVVYFGSYYEVEVVIAGERIRVRTGRADVMEGDRVDVGLNVVREWYV